MFASDYRRLARESLEGNWGQAVLAAVLVGILGGSLNAGGFNFDFDLNLVGEELNFLSADIWHVLFAAGAFFSVLSIAQFVIGGAIQLGYCKYLLKQYDRQKPEISDLFSQFNRLGEGLCLRLLTALFIILWSLLFIIPGIVASYSYAMAPFIMAEDPECTAQVAIRRSKELMQGHKAELFWLELSFIGWALLSVFTCGIGAFFLVPYTDASRAAFYRNLWANENV